MSFYSELKRRNVFKVGIAYAVITWILFQLTTVVTEILAWPEWTAQLIVLIMVVAFIPALILAWAFEITPEGIKLHKEVDPNESIAARTGRKLDITIIVLLGLTLAYFIWETRFEQQTAEFESAEAEAARKAEQSQNEQPELPPLVIEPLSPDIDQNSIAVLPFANRSADVEDLYFTDGIHEDLLIQLSRIDAFSVISKTSVMGYRNTTKNMRQIASELSVANILEGAVQRSGNRVRINVQLIDAYTDEHLWAEIYDRELTTSNLFDIQSEIAQAIAVALQATLSESELATVAQAPTENVAAYDLYLQGRQSASEETLSGYQTALKLFKEALTLDADFKEAWIGLAKAHITNYWTYGGDPADRQKAREAIERAKQIDSGFSDLYMAEGFYWYWGHQDYERALYNLDKAIEMAPGHSEPYMWKGWVSRRAGKWEQALESMELALKLDPRVHVNWVEYASTFVFLHRYQQAHRAFELAMNVDPDNFWGKTGLADLALQEKGDVERAKELTIGAQHTDEPDFFDSWLMARIFARDFEEALAGVQELADEKEIRLLTVTLREDLSARILHFMGRQEEAREAARAAQFRLKALRANQGASAFAIDTADAMANAILGSPHEEIRAMIQKSNAAKPDDELEGFRFKMSYARIYAMAGMTKECVALLEPLLSPISDTSVHMVALDPAFDGIRNELEFVAMMQRHQSMPD